MSDDATVVCGACGGFMEHGYLTGSMGRWWGGSKLGWLSGQLKTRHFFVQGEPLYETLVGGIRAPAQRCVECRLVSFRYPEE